MNIIKKIIHAIYINVLSVFVATAIRLYFKRWQVVNKNNIPHNGSVIFAANHQNAFLDPLVILLSQKRFPSYLVRANIFKNPIAKFWLESLYMLPIYRVRDGIRAVAKNDEIIEKCVKILTKRKNPLVIFAEGNHNLRRALRPLQKGVARIAFATMEANNFELDLTIIPTGLNYGRHTRFRSDMLINYGKPIYLKKYTELYKENPNKAVQTLVTDIYEELDKVVLSIRPSIKYAQIENEWLHKRASSSDMLEEFNNDKKIIHDLSVKYSNKDTVASDEYTKEPIPPLPPFLYRILLFPIFIYGFINSFISYKLLSVLIKKVVTDIHFYASIKSSINIILAPSIFLLQSYIVYIATGNGLISILYFISLPFAAILAFDYKFAVFDRLQPMKGIVEYEH